MPAFGSSYGDDPRPGDERLLQEVHQADRQGRARRQYPILGYSTVQTIAKGIEKAGTTKGAKLGKALDSFKDVRLLAGPTTYTPACHVPVGREMLMIEYRNGKPRSTGQFVEPEKVPKYPC